MCFLIWREKVVIRFQFTIFALSETAIYDGSEVNRLL